ncbi:MAG: cytochrome d ubiquinol oxidase subunit II [Polyangiales bacterium]
MLQHVWFVIVAALLGVYVVLDGFDIGAGILHLRVSKNDEEREAVLRSIGPVWDGNEVWLLVVGGTLVLAFPALYARSFSGFYLPLMIVLWLLVFRALGIEMRHQLSHRLWHQLWDAAFCTASFSLAILFGAALGNVVRGVDMDVQGHFFAPLWTDFSVGPHPGVLDWYTLLTALTTACALAQHGALWLIMRVQGEVGRRSQSTLARLWPVVLVLVALTTAATYLVQPQMRHNLGAYPLGWIAPGLSVGGLVGVRWFASKARWPAAFLASSVFLFGMLFSAAFAIYPYVLPARDAALGLTLQQAASNPYELRVALCWFVPGILIALGYSIYNYRIWVD